MEEASSNFGAQRLMTSSDCKLSTSRLLAGMPNGSRKFRTYISNGFCWVTSGQTDFDGYAVLAPRHFFVENFLELPMVSPSYSEVRGREEGVLPAPS